MTTQLPSFLKQPIRLDTQYRDYVWGGSRLIPGKSPIAEAWMVHENNIIRAPRELAGRTLGYLTNQYGAALLGRLARKNMPGFPLLIKLLDCAEWLSLQVHPNDELAQQMEGEGKRGKTEAWHFIAAAPNAEILCGFIPATDRAAFDSHLNAGSLLEITRRVPVQSGDSIFIPAGTVHALGPGLFVYEVQQTSDITYRVYDWDRPATPQRPLHIEQSRRAADLESAPNPVEHPPAPADGDRSTLVTSGYFTLDMLQSSSLPILLDTAGETFHALTAIHGTLQVQGDGWVEMLNELETVLLPAALGAYQVIPNNGAFEALLARLPSLH